MGSAIEFHRLIHIFTKWNGKNQVTKNKKDLQFAMEKRLFKVGYILNNYNCGKIIRVSKNGKEISNDIWTNTFFPPPNSSF